jgi:hypothetical protein
MWRRKKWIFCETAKQEKSPIRFFIFMKTILSNLQAFKDSTPLYVIAYIGNYELSCILLSSFVDKVSSILKSEFHLSKVWFSSLKPVCFLTVQIPQNVKRIVSVRRGSEVFLWCPEKLQKLGDFLFCWGHTWSQQAAINKRF